MYGVSDIIFLFANWNIWYHGSTFAQTMLDFLQQQLLLFCTQQLHSLQNVSTETEEILIGLVLIVSFNWCLCDKSSIFTKSSPIKTKKQRRRKEAQKTVKYGISWIVLKLKTHYTIKKVLLCIYWHFPYFARRCLNILCFSLTRSSSSLQPTPQIELEAEII